jgi:hypothetical protein
VQDNRSDLVSLSGSVHTRCQSIGISSTVLDSSRDAIWRRSIYPIRNIPVIKHLLKFSVNLRSGIESAFSSYEGEKSCGSLN